jgi:glycosyltransferase involved in cell wall biosynthesis
VILEAGLASLPIISTSVGGIPEVLKDMNNGILVHKENPNEIVQAIEYMITHPERASEFSKKIHSEVSRHFSKTKMLRETTALYN